MYVTDLFNDMVFYIFAKQLPSRMLRKIERSQIKDGLKHFLSIMSSIVMLPHQIFILFKSTLLWFHERK